MICFTSFALNYLPRARVLAETLRAAHPDWTLCALLVDEPRAPLDLPGFDRVVLARDLGIPRFRGWMFRHGIVEACTAVKGAMLCRLLDEGAEAVVYLDPDIALFHPLTALPGLLDAASVLLTPHQIAPNDAPAAIADNEGAALRYGVFNLGFLAVRGDPAGRAFARWWAARTQDACFDAPERGLFVDQKYCDLAPALFDRVGIVRDAGWNVASWNVSRRQLAISPAGNITVNGVPLGFYHFSKHGGVGDAMTDRYAGTNPVPHELWRWYGRRLAAYAQAAPAWHYGCYSDGTPVAPEARRMYRQRPDLTAHFADPFDAAAGGFRDWFAANAATPLPRAARPSPPAGSPARRTGTSR